MRDDAVMDLSPLDRRGVSMFLFYPRPESGWESPPASGQAVMIPVDKSVSIGGFFHMGNPSWPNILFFHGNGEIAADYHDMGQIYNQWKINFMPVDYRGYGRSGGSPTVTAMMRDCLVIFDFIRSWLNEKCFNGPLILMGRSLGSASALELAFRHTQAIDGLIIESGFAYAAPLLRLLGIDVQAIGFEEKNGFRNVDKIRLVDKPVLIIHAERDHIIPFSDGQALYDACGSRDKTLLKIPGANHNDLMHRGFTEYMTAVKTLTARASIAKGIVT
jgi:hypothetical protein